MQSPSIQLSSNTPSNANRDDSLSGNTLKFGSRHFSSKCWTSGSEDQYRGCCSQTITQSMKSFVSERYNENYYNDCYKSFSCSDVSSGAQQITISLRRNNQIYKCIVPLEALVKIFEKQYLQEMQPQLIHNFNTSEKKFHYAESSVEEVETTETFKNKQHREKFNQNGKCKTKSSTFRAKNSYSKKTSGKNDFSKLNKNASKCNASYKVFCSQHGHHSIARNFNTAGCTYHSLQKKQNHFLHDYNCYYDKLNAFEYIWTNFKRLINSLTNSSLFYEKKNAVRRREIRQKNSPEQEHSILLSNKISETPKKSIKSRQILSAPNLYCDSQRVEQKKKSMNKDKLHENTERNKRNGRSITFEKDSLVIINVEQDNGNKKPNEEEEIKNHWESTYEEEQDDGNLFPKISQPTSEPLKRFSYKRQPSNPRTSSAQNKLLKDKLLLAKPNNSVDDVVRKKQKLNLNESPLINEEGRKKDLTKNENSLLLSESDHAREPEKPSLILNVKDHQTPTEKLSTPNSFSNSKLTGKSPSDEEFDLDEMKKLSTVDESTELKNYKKKWQISNDDSLNSFTLLEPKVNVPYSRHNHENGTTKKDSLGSSKILNFVKTINSPTRNHPSIDSSRSKQHSQILPPPSSLDTLSSSLKTHYFYPTHTKGSVILHQHSRTYKHLLEHTNNTFVDDMINNKDVSIPTLPEQKESNYIGNVIDKEESIKNKENKQIFNDSSNASTNFKPCETIKFVKKSYNTCHQLSKNLPKTKSKMNFDKNDSPLLKPDSKRNKNADNRTKQSKKITSSPFKKKANLISVTKNESLKHVKKHLTICDKTLPSFLNKKNFKLNFKNERKFHSVKVGNQRIMSNSIGTDLKFKTATEISEQLKAVTKNINKTDSKRQLMISKSCSDKVVCKNLVAATKEEEDLLVPADVSFAAT
ncbi:hypothetical protein HELRODRAFT_160624 [Helobdella robusta]|uniref:Uncharacterized protein n=1 Tax=Helobdella robusta TaxID=6412 RepID=T1EQI3_HELRO|nr:hypothetical protein HELRODRAFT_160624 [Helobdella robusta]ESO06452.1 hypothetical protein HELRODRAFT_160624 [Helobdella robusta]